MQSVKKVYVLCYYNENYIDFMIKIEFEMSKDKSNNILGIS